jgi:hypothetical protein
MEICGEIIMSKVFIAYPSIGEESQENVIHELLTLSQKLQDLLPDPSLSPLERVERLARVIPESIQNSSEHLTARKKLNQIRLRLAELLPKKNGSASEKIDFLVDKVHQLVPGETARLFEKLEKIGDCRMIDNGAVPFTGWNLESRFWPHLKEKTDGKKEGDCVLYA